MATAIGIFIGLLLLLTAILRGGAGVILLNPEAIMITLGGTLAATLISFPLDQVSKIFTLVIRLFQRERRDLLAATQARLVEISHQASKESVFSLEKDAGKEPNRYLEIALKLLTQNTSAPLLMRRFTIEMEGVRTRHRQGTQLFSFMAKAAPSFGLVGTLIGLISMLRGAGGAVQPDMIGSGLAVAFSAMLYGALLSFLLFLPAAEKLQAFSALELVTIAMVRDATLMIHEGRTSREVEEMLNAYLPPAGRGSTLEQLMLRQNQTRPPQPTEHAAH